MSSAPRSVPSSLNSTPTTPDSSDASATIINVPETVEPPGGKVRETAGGVMSGAGVLPTLTVTWLDAPTETQRATPAAKYGHTILPGPVCRADGRWYLCQPIMLSLQAPAPGSRIAIDTPGREDL